jgi:adenosine deaminase
MLVRAYVFSLIVIGLGCGRSDEMTRSPDGGADTMPDAAAPDAAPACTGTPTECAAQWEQAASDRFDALLTNPAGLEAFLKAVPKGGDLHNHLSGAVYAETYLDWAMNDGDCINTTSYAAVSSCGSGTAAVPTNGTFFDAIVRAWSMEGFVAGAESGHDHFFATFGKYGLVAGAHRDETIADVLKRAADENEVYVETMFNLAKNVGSLSASVWSGTLTANDLPTLYNQLTTNAGFATAVTNDVAVVNSAKSGYRAVLGCDDVTAPAACDVGVRFIAQVSRTGPNDQVFGQLVGAFEMASRTNQIVALNLSSPEDDAASIANYNLHMAMLDFLHTKYASTSPLHVTLHAGELTAAYLPANSTANTFHIRAAVETGHAERIGHGLDIMSETDPAGLMAAMAANKVAVEVCLSSNVQILEVSGTAHPLAAYLAAGVPVALATDDQGVSRSSMAGEYMRAALDQHLTYRQLKTLARNSLEHAFLPGPSLWTTIGTPVSACAPTDTMGIGDMPSAECAAFLATSERAQMQWKLEGRFLAFESKQ